MQDWSNQFVELKSHFFSYTHCDLYTYGLTKASDK